MSSQRRVLTLRVLTQSARARTASNVFNQVDQELQELGAVIRVHPEKRKNLLQLLHAVRALETALKEMIRSRGIQPAPSLSPVFRQLQQIPLGQPGYLSSANARRFNQTIRVARNRFAHEANAFPRSAREAESLLSEIEACFSLTVR
jgi:hypothetical protein